MPRRIVPLACALLVAAACGSSPTEQATPEIRSQYLTIARIAADRTDLAISDSDWLEFADIVCRRKLLDDEDYDELITEIESGAPTPQLGRAARDVGYAAVSLFCPPEF